MTLQFKETSKARSSADDAYCTVTQIRLCLFSFIPNLTKFCNICDFEKLYL